MLFHNCSEKIYRWLDKQPHVKEESLTDWLLYTLSENCSQIYYQAFSRHEEAENGCDWEWWVLTSDTWRKQECNAYRFLVQAKKLYANNRDNYSLLNYGNKNGTQIDLLLKEAASRNALPLYMYYSMGEADTDEQIKNSEWLGEEIIRWCDTCVNGGYLALATVVYGLLYEVPRHKLLDVDLLNHALKLSLVDLIFDDNPEKKLSYLNKIIMWYIPDLPIYKDPEVHGIKHMGKSIPQYLWILLQNQGGKVDWFEREMRIPHIGGVGIIDLRENCN